MNMNGSRFCGVALFATLHFPKFKQSFEEPGSSSMVADFQWGWTSLRLDASFLVLSLTQNYQASLFEPTLTLSFGNE